MNLAIHEPWEKSVRRAEENCGPRGVEDVKFLQFEMVCSAAPSPFLAFFKTAEVCGLWLQSRSSQLDKVTN